MTDEQAAKELTYGELMMLCEGHGTSKIYERHLETLAARERAVLVKASDIALGHECDTYAECCDCRSQISASIRGGL